jgi:transcriptional regulator with XRE-family HTH domain
MPATSNTVEINGYLIRELRKRDGLSVVELAERVGVKRPYIANIELGHRRRVSLKMFNALIGAFAVEDRRSLLANPYGDVVDLEEAS